MAFGDLGFHLYVPIVQVPARVSHPFTELPGHCVVVVTSRVGFIAPEEGRVGSGSRAPAQGKRTGGKEAFRELGPSSSARLVRLRGGAETRAKMGSPSRIDANDMQYWHSRISDNTELTCAGGGADTRKGCVMPAVRERGCAVEE
ncbi:hypothetical protein CYMTET_10010, partial [Cymbomonas tetramitiformis]